MAQLLSPLSFPFFFYKGFGGANVQHTWTLQHIHACVYIYIYFCEVIRCCSHLKGSIVTKVLLPRPLKLLKGPRSLIAEFVIVGFQPYFWHSSMIRVALIFWPCHHVIKLGTANQLFLEQWKTKPVFRICLVFQFTNQNVFFVACAKHDTNRL